MSDCKIVIQTVMAQGFALPGWFCQTHRMAVGPEDKRCAIGRVDEAADQACARIDLEVGRCAAEKSDKIKKALSL
jgi:hypothetical protein